MELKERLKELRDQRKLLEAQRLQQRTLYDLELLEEMGFCPGIENYSRHLTGRQPGEPPPTLLSYFPNDFLLVIDESHVTVPQIGGMYRGDRSRKETLVEYGFRLPSALDNRPLNFDEFAPMINQTIYVSATPAPFELRESNGAVVEQVIRPTGLMDPAIMVRPARTQVDDLLEEIRTRVERKERVLVTTLTKRMAEDLTEYYQDLNVKVRYLHSDIETLERVEIIRQLRSGQFDVLVGINLAARRVGFAGSVFGGDSRRRQRRLSALRPIADPDHRPGRAQRERHGDSLRRRRHRFDEARHGRNRAAAPVAGGVQQKAWDHAANDYQSAGLTAGEDLRRGLCRHSDGGGRRRTISPRRVEPADCASCKRK